MKVKISRTFRLEIVEQEPDHFVVLRRAPYAKKKDILFSGPRMEVEAFRSGWESGYDSAEEIYNDRMD